jgi:hypothetical protein
MVNPNDEKTRKFAARIWRKYSSPRNEDYLYAGDLIPLIDAAAGGRTYLFSAEAETIPGIKTILASINQIKPNKDRFDKGVETLIKSSSKIWKK